MKKTLLLSIFCLFLASCTAMPSTPTTMRLNATQGLATPSIVPTPTVDLQSTASAALDVAKYAVQTSEAANIAVAVITADAKQAELETARITQEAFAVAVSGTQAVINATAIAYPTSVALTATQQAAMNTQIPLQQALQSGQLTATHEAPEIMNAMTRAQDAQKYSWVETFVRLFVLFSVGVCLLAVGAFALKYQHPKVTVVPDARPMPPVQTYQEPVQTFANETVINLRTDYGGGFFKVERTIIPCAPDKLTALAEGVLNKGIALGVNNWEGANSPFRGKSYVPVLNWLQLNKYVESEGQGKKIPSPAGESFFIEWLNNRKLPEGYEFGEKENA